MSFVVTAVAAAIELGTVAAIATAVTQVGIAMTVVGTVTKSKELTKIGGILSIAGGVTSLASAAYGAATGAAGSAAGGATAAAGNAAGELGSDSLWSELSNQAVADINANAAAGALENITVDGFAGAASADASTSLAADALGSAGDKLAGSLGSEAASAAADKGTQSLVGAATNNATTDSGLLNLSNTGSAAGDVAAGAAPVNVEALQSTDFVNGVAKAPTLGESTKDWWSKLSPDAKTRIGTTVLQAGGSAIGGMFQGWTADKRLELEKEIRDEARKNANAVPSVTYKKPGLVNSVTGVK